MHRPQKPAFRLDDLPIFLAALRSGNTTRAARILETDQSTVSRRLAALEKALGVTLFDRTGSGLRETDAARAILAYAEQIEGAADDVSRVVSGFESEPEGLVRVAAPPEIANELIAPRIGNFLAERAPKIRLELLTTTAVLDLSRREADIAIIAVRPEIGRDVIVTRVAEIEYGIFVSAGYLAKRSPAARGRGGGGGGGGGGGRGVCSVASVLDLDWIAWDEAHAMIPEAQWLIALGVDPGRCVLRAGSVTAHRRAVAGGAGAALLARAVATLEQDFVEVTIGNGKEKELDMRLPIYLLGHQALRHVPRIQVVWDFLSNLFAETFPPREAQAQAPPPRSRRNANLSHR